MVNTDQMIYTSTSGALLFHAYLDRQIDFNGFSSQWLNYLAILTLPLQKPDLLPHLMTTIVY